MSRCVIVINNGQPGHGHPVSVVNDYITSPPTDINRLKFKHIPILHSFLRRHKITRKYLPHVDKLRPIQQVNLAIFGYHMEVLEDLADRLERGQGISRQQQAFINSIASGGGNGPYWAWFMELKCAVELVELTV
ncbi:uncharacterized protein FPRO_16000 [Fusarium proliferatum ET1]|uniref:Uncharacterized protein n=1 Tax=Fusarium proliferatum (strain ET1) TaxID=1227346 RepID=A0A1L7WAZ2_FUSPR|nr:uncharacterized protein FPRO_16000 [Fusarium proliferatum ET1]CZR49791.1 uncharacterized protein FPRO_16000 [Fusarium proliferatum ET1]